MERILPLRKVGSSNPGRVKPTRDTWGLALLRQDKDCLAQYQDDVIEWDIESWCRLPDLPMWQHYKVVSQGGIRPAMTIYVARA